MFQSNSKTVSRNPPVQNAITGVPATKNSCWTIPPGSNSEGIKPKSLPRFTFGPSVKNSFGLAQKEFGYFERRSFILPTHCSKYGSP